MKYLFVFVAGIVAALWFHMVYLREFSLADIGSANIEEQRQSFELVDIQLSGIKTRLAELQQCACR